MIFQDLITSLEPGDEVGIFDNHALLNSGDCSSQVGLALVGAGVWTGEQLEIVSVGSVDNCAFGGFQLPGYQQGNSATIKVYRDSNETEYTATATYAAGTGTFGDLFMAVSGLELGEGQVVESCEDESACNTGDPGDCEYAEDNYDC